MTLQSRLQDELIGEDESHAHLNPDKPSDLIAANRIVQRNQHRISLRNALPDVVATIASDLKKALPMSKTHDNGCIARQSNRCNCGALAHNKAIEQFVAAIDRYCLGDK